MARRLNTTGSFGFSNVQNNSNYADSNAKRIPMFRGGKDVHAEFLTNKTSIRGVILPAFDPSLSEEDMSRPTSVGGYRDTYAAQDDKGNYPLSAWSVTVEGYNFMGKSGQTFISPKVLGQPDPIIDLRKYIYNKRNKENDRTYMNLVKLENPEAWREQRVALPGTQPLTVVNIWGTGSNANANDYTEYKNRVLVLKKAAFEHLVEDLNRECPRSVRQPRDVMNEDYLLGDITSPRAALVFESRTVETKNSSGKTLTPVGLHFGDLVSDPEGGKRLNCKEVTIPSDVLAGRYDLSDVDNFLYIPTYDEIVQMLIAEGTVPFELIEMVCGEKCVEPLQAPERTAPAPTASPAPQFPQFPQPAASKFNLKDEDPADDIDYSPAPAAAPVLPPMPTPAPTPAPAPVAAPAASPASGLTPEEEAELQALVDLAQREPAALTPDKTARISMLFAKKNTAM